MGKMGIGSTGMGKMGMGSTGMGKMGVGGQGWEEGDGENGDGGHRDAENGDGENGDGGHRDVAHRDGGNGDGRTAMGARGWGAQGWGDTDGSTGIERTGTGRTGMENKEIGAQGWEDMRMGTLQLLGHCSSRDTHAPTLGPERCCCPIQQGSPAPASLPIPSPVIPRLLVELSSSIPARHAAPGSGKQEVAGPIKQAPAD